MRKILLLLPALLFFFACSDNANDPAAAVTEQISPACDSCIQQQYGDTLLVFYGFGSGMSSSYSECEWIFSAHCKKVRKKPAAVFGDVKPLAAVDKMEPFSPAGWNSLTALLQPDSVRKLEDRYIPAGYADGVVEWLAVSQNGKTKQVVFAYGQEPDAIAPLVKKLRVLAKEE